MSKKSSCVLWIIAVPYINLKTRKWT